MKQIKRIIKSRQIGFSISILKTIKFFKNWKLNKIKNWGTQVKYNPKGKARVWEFEVL